MKECHGIFFLVNVMIFLELINFAYLVWNVILFNQSEFHKHPNYNFVRNKRAHWDVVELIAVKMMVFSI
jgi:hypothetical protein